MRHFLFCSLLVLSMATGRGSAEMIDFETGFARLDAVSSIPTASNRLTVTTSSGVELFIANAGVPKDAFEREVDGTLIYDLPIFEAPLVGDVGGFFLTDGAEGRNNFAFQFERPVNQFSLDLYDFVGDGGARPTDFATLRAFSDVSQTVEVDSDQWLVPRPRPTDGKAVKLAVEAPVIRALLLEFSTFDRGTGLDNIEFVTIPEPATIGLVAMAGLLVCIWRFRAEPCG